ncbi:MAG: response regulator [Euryarchaeota archaeon]|nr:response regulator [Euryarchaeota archaeon]
MAFDLATAHLGTAVATGLAYLFVAWLVAHREVPARLRAARGAFCWWWVTLAMMALLGFFPGLLTTPLADQKAVVVSLGTMLLITGGSAAILYYQAVLLGITKWPGRVVAVYYTGMFLGYTAFVLSAGPASDGRFGSIVYSNAWIAPGGTLHPALTISYFWFMLGPGLIGTAVHLWATDRLQDKEVRERSYTIAASLFVWYLFVLVGSISILSGAVPPWLLFTARMVNLVAVAMVCLALFRSRQTGPFPGAVSDLVTHGAQGDMGRKHVLLVDDEAPILESLSIILEEFTDSGPKIWLARSGEEAVALLDQERFDLIMSDYRMNGLSGADVLEWAARVQPDAVRVLLTGYSEDSVVMDAVERGHVHAYALKPWDVGNMVADVDKWLTSDDVHEAAKEQVLEFLTRSRALV